MTLCETLMFLHANKQLWGDSEVNKIINVVGNDYDEYTSTTSARTAINDYERNTLTGNNIPNIHQLRLLICKQM